MKLKIYELLEFVEQGERKTICTLPQFKAQNQCRSCDDSHHWRCDSGWCIDMTERRNGIADCPNDSSDEESSGTFGKILGNLWDL